MVYQKNRTPWNKNKGWKPNVLKKCKTIGCCEDIPYIGGGESTYKKYTKCVRCRVKYYPKILKKCEREGCHNDIPYKGEEKKGYERNKTCSEECRYDRYIPKELKSCTIEGCNLHIQFTIGIGEKHYKRQKLCDLHKKERMTPYYPEKLRKCGAKSCDDNIPYKNQGEKGYKNIKTCGKRECESGWMSEARNIDTWSIEYDCCIICDKTEYEHRSHGLCEKCGGHYYWEKDKKNTQRKRILKDLRKPKPIKKRTRTFTQKQKERRKIVADGWHKKHREYQSVKGKIKRRFRLIVKFKDYYLNPEMYKRMVNE